MNGLREKIADIVVGEIGPQNPNFVEVYAIADAILAIPEIRDALSGKPRCMVCGKEQATAIYCDDCEHYANMEA